MMHSRTTLTAIILALLACAIWAGNFVVARGVHDLIPPITLAFWRWFLAFIIFLPFTYRALYHQRHLLYKHWRYIGLMAWFGISMMNTMFYLAGHYTTAHHMSLISSISPILTLLLAALWKFEAFTYRNLIGGFCALFGVITVITHGHPLEIMNIEGNLGDVLMVCTGIIWASWNIALKAKPKALSSRVFLTVIMGLGSLFLFPFYLWERQKYPLPTLTLSIASIFLYVSLCASVIAWLAWDYSVRTIGAVKTSLIYYTIPVFSSVLAVSILNEPLALYHLLGFTLVFTGIVISQRKPASLFLQKP